jgi:lipid II:glycine glycyltransferase (peptidoglycan interpeptide bridge formation enzyme)
MDQIPAGWDQQQIKNQASFLQSGQWGEFQSRVGVKPHYLSGSGWTCLILEKRNKIGKYLFSQYGPTVKSPADLKAAIDYMTDYGRRSGAAWLSLEPISSKTSPDDLKHTMLASGAKVSARHREPELTRIIDLSPSPDDLLAGISQSTRSFIRKNQREKFINFKSSTDPSDISIFTRMLMGVAERKNIYFYNENYFKKQAETLMPAGMMHLELAYENDKPVAAALFHDYGQMSTYTFAASLPEARKTSASALLLWQAMLNAKQRGLTKMDLYGIAPDNAGSDHPWSGFTSFKQKFGGQVVAHAGTWDVPLNSRYHLYRAAHQLRRKVKRH